MGALSWSKGEHIDRSIIDRRLEARAPRAERFFRAMVQERGGIADRRKQFDYRLWAPITMVSLALNKQIGSVALKRFPPASQNSEFVPFDVYLNEADVLDLEIVEPSHFDFNGLFPFEIYAVTDRRISRHNVTGIANRHAQRGCSLNIRQSALFEPNIGPRPLKFTRHNWVWLKRYNGGAASDQRTGVRTPICANVERYFSLIGEQRYKRLLWLPFATPCCKLHPRTKAWRDRIEAARCARDLGPKGHRRCVYQRARFSATGVPN